VRLHHRRLIIWVVGVMVVVCTPQASRAEAAVARCFGSKATIVGSSGDDVLTGTSGVDVIVGLGGRDRVNGLGGGDRICGGAGEDELIGGPGKDRMDGGEGRDGLRGGSGADRLLLGPNPTLYDPDGVPYGDGGNGGPGNDVIFGSTGLDALYGGSGNDRLYGGPGNDIGYGGAGTDEWGYAAWAPVANRRSDMDRFYGGPGNDGSHGGDIGGLRIYGGQGDDRLDGGNSNDRLEGGPGNDTLQGFRGNDTLRGGAGRDTISFATRFSEATGTSGPSISKMRIDLQLGRARGLGNDRLDSVEAVIPGYNSDVLLGSRRSETFYLSAQSGGDVIHGRGGRDTIGPEPDPGYCCPMMRVNLAQRWAWYDYEGAPVDADSLNRITSIENVVGTDQNDVLLGDGRNNTIFGRGGDDDVDGRAGSDQLFGGPGNDRLDGGAGRNRNDGGPGTDHCTNPAQGAGTRSCEAPVTG